MNRKEKQIYVMMILTNFVIFFGILYLSLKISNTVEGGAIGLLIGFFTVMIIVVFVNPIIFRDLLEERKCQEREEVEKEI